MEFNRWWSHDKGEVYWLEITDRKNLGVDLNAPQQNDEGNEYYGYSLIKEINDGDIIFHYHKDYQAIIAMSKAEGGVWEDEVLWGAHGTTARGEGIRPYKRPGWRLGLVDFRNIMPPVSLKQLRALQLNVQDTKNHLVSKYRGSLYFPFELSQKRELRPTQAYLTKLPRDIVQLIAPAYIETQRSNSKVGSSHTIVESKVPYLLELGAPYRPADEEVSISERDPFTVDPALVERANRSHASTQNALAEYLRSKGLDPRSPQPGEPNFDLAWLQEDIIFVAEVKSLTIVNEEKQLRLGLGQVLRYQHLLASNGKRVRTILMVERKPSDTSWIDLCQNLGILLVWPAIMASYL